MKILREFTVPSDQIMRAGRIILWMREDIYHPFVTHWQAKNGDKYSGHYFSNINPANKDFEDRVRKELRGLNVELIDDKLKFVL